jgi:transaldolase
MKLHADNGPEHLRKLFQAFSGGPVFYQLTSEHSAAAPYEIEAIINSAGEHRERLVIKLPAQPWLYGLGADLVERGLHVAYTAVYSPGQVICAVDAGVEWVIPYVDRASRLDRDSGPLVPRLAPFVPAGVGLLAASIKSADQAISSLNEGANAITTSWSVIEAMMSHALTDSAVEEFQALNR